jgi:hypothetical protein
MNEMVIGTPTLEIRVRCKEDPYTRAKAAYEAALEAAGETSLHALRIGSEVSSSPPRGSIAARVRTIAAGVLADGKLHKRREIVAAVRAAGLDPQPLTQQLKGHFTRVEQPDGAYYRKQEEDDSEEQLRRFDEGVEEPLTTLSTFGALRMHSVRTGVVMAEPWWQLIAYCPRCAKRYTRAKPDWKTCLECEVSPKWTTVATAEFIAEAKRVFPGSHEPVRSIDTAPSASKGPEQLSLDEAA